ncbi:MAG: VanZ family protein [Clostridiales bacterium]|nr:VanZ family protein [Clostridiales bacterium]
MDEVTAISFVVLAAALALPVITGALEERHQLLQWIRYVIFTVYVFANLYETLLFRVVTPEPRYELGLLWSYREALSIHRDGGSGIRLLITDYGLLKEIILNILLYIPLGYLLPFTWPALARGRGDTSPESGLSWLVAISHRIVPIGLICSVLTELSQLLFHLGLFEFDDIINNTLGCFLGVGLYWLLMRRP